MHLHCSRTPLPVWAHRYADLLDRQLYGDLTLWRAATGTGDDDRRLAGPAPDQPAAAGYHRHLLTRINQPYSEVVRAWEDKVVDYLGYRDEQTLLSPGCDENHQRRGGLTQDTVARRSGTSQPTLSAYERVTKSPTLAVVERILHSLGYQLGLQPRVTFREVPDGRDPARCLVPDQLWRVDHPTASRRSRCATATAAAARSTASIGKGVPRRTRGCSSTKPRSSCSTIWTAPSWSLPGPTSRRG